MYEGMMDGTLYRDTYLVSALLIATLAFLVWRAVKARTRGGRAACLVLALALMAGVLLAPAALDALGWAESALRSAAAAARDLSAPPE